MAISDTGRTIAIARADNGVSVVDLESGATIFTVSTPSPGVALGFDAECALLVAGCRTADCVVFDLRRQSTVGTFRNHAMEVNAVRFLSRTNRIVSASKDHTVRMWHATEGHDLLGMFSSGATCERLFVSPDGERVVAVTEDALLLVSQPTATLQGSR